MTLSRWLDDVDRAGGHPARRTRFGGEVVDDLYRRPRQPDAAFDDLHPEQAAEHIATLIAEGRAADQAVAHLPLDHQFVSDRWGPMSLGLADRCQLTEAP